MKLKESLLLMYICLLYSSIGNDCICDKSPQICELNCCCDLQCSLDTIVSFELCDDRNLNQICVRKGIIVFTNVPYEVIDIQDMYTCIYYQEEEKKVLKDAINFNEVALSSENILLNFERTSVSSVYAKTVHSFYEINDPIYIINDKKVLGFFAMPTRLNSHLCTEPLPIGFGVDMSAVCYISSNLLESCENEPFFNIDSYIKSFRVIKSMDIFTMNIDPKPKDFSLNNRLYTGYVDPDGGTLLIPVSYKNGVFKCSATECEPFIFSKIEDLEKPFLGIDECVNVVFQADYEFIIIGNEIDEVKVQLYYGVEQLNSIRNSTSESYRSYSVKFTQRNDNLILGYKFGNYIETSQLNGSKFVKVYKKFQAFFTMPLSETKQNVYTNVQFGHNFTTASCINSTSFNSLLDSNCSELHKRIWEISHNYGSSVDYKELKQSRYLGRILFSSVNKLEDWIEIIGWNNYSDAIEEYDDVEDIYKCPTLKALHRVILFARVGERSRPQLNLLFAKEFHDYRTITYSIPTRFRKPFCVTSSLTFIELKEKMPNYDDFLIKIK